MEGWLRRLLVLICFIRAGFLNIDGFKAGEAVVIGVGFRIIEFDVCLNKSGVLITYSIY